LTGIVSKAKEYPSVTNIASVLEILQGVHQGSARSGTEKIESVAIAASLYLCKIALANPIAENVSAIADIYKSSLNSYLIKKSCRLHGRFFESFLNRYRDAAWQLRGDFLEACSEATKTADKHRRAACFHLLSALLATHAALKTPEAKQEVIDFVPEYVQVFIDTFKAATEGTGMQLQIARLREILKACAEAVKATKNALKDGPDVAPWDLWRAKELAEVFAHMSQSKNIEKTGSLNSTIRSLMDSINQGSGRAKVRVVKKGEPVMLPTDENGKPLTRLDQRQIKKALVRPEKEARRAAQELKKENKKRKRQETDLNEHESTSKQNASEDHGASTSEDSD
jgi:DNA polymerase phi